jgi:hypothetical protein
LILQRLKQGLPPHRIGTLGPKHFNRQHVALGINEEVALAAPDLLT